MEFVDFIVDTGAYEGPFHRRPKADAGSHEAGYAGEQHGEKWSIGGASAVVTMYTRYCFWGIRCTSETNIRGPYMTRLRRMWTVCRGRNGVPSTNTRFLCARKTTKHRITFIAPRMNQIGVRLKRRLRQNLRREGTYAKHCLC